MAAPVLPLNVAIAAPAGLVRYARRSGARRRVRRYEGPSRRAALRRRALDRRRRELDDVLAALLAEGILQRVGDLLVLAPQQAGPARKRRCALIQRMWLEGATEEQIAHAARAPLGWITRDIHQMRAWGWHLPYRYPSAARRATSRQHGVRAG